MRRGRQVVFTVMLALGGCASSGLDRPERAIQRRANVVALLVLMPDSPTAQETLQGLRDEIGEDFDLIPRFVDAQSTAEEIAVAMRDVAPRLVILMNNPTVRLYRVYQASAPEAERKIPAVAVLSSFLRESSEGIGNITGIVYEVPLVTSLVNLRDLLAQPLVKVGVVYRPSFAGFIEEQRGLTKGEGFEIVAVEVQGESVRDLRAGLGQLLEKDRVDVLWVLNDNVLLDRRMLQRGWLPALRDSRTPVLVNVGSLLSSRVTFGTFGVLPDHRAMGTQAGALVATIADQAYQLDGIAFEYPLSVEKVLDVGFARKNLSVREQGLATVDRLIE